VELRHGADGDRALEPAGTLLGVAALGYPGHVLEIDLTAALPDADR
jgi:hypothetical protein